MNLVFGGTTDEFGKEEDVAHPKDGVAALIKGES
jgi:hypothetical protein